MTETDPYKYIFDFIPESEEMNTTRFIKFKADSLPAETVEILTCDDYSIDLKFLGDGRLKEIIFQKTYDRHLESNIEIFSSPPENHFKSALLMLTVLYCLPYPKYKNRLESPSFDEYPSKIPLSADSNIDNSSIKLDLDVIDSNVNREFQSHEDQLKNVFKVSKNNNNDDGKRLINYFSEFLRIKNLDSTEGKLIDIFAFCEIIANEQYGNSEWKYDRTNGKYYIPFDRHRKFEVNSWTRAARDLVGHGTITRPATVKAAKDYLLNLQTSRSTPDQENSDQENQNHLTLDRRNPDHVKMIKDATKEFLNCVFEFLRNELERLAGALEH